MILQLVLFNLDFLFFSLFVIESQVTLTVHRNLHLVDVCFFILGALILYYLYMLHGTPLALNQGVFRTPSVMPQMLHTTPNAME